jgi:hypothetical protein
MNGYLGFLKPFFHIKLDLKPFGSDDIDTIDKTLKSLISQGLSTKACANEPRQREVEPVDI